MHRYLVIVEQGPNNYSAYSPDLPGCASAGDTVEETLAHFREALKMHLEGILEDRDPIPQISSLASQFMEVEVPHPGVRNRV
ncbi:MAG TPA: type II toxin-antitoxin system HicB family antitoxin [Chloroflexia bacterium]|nr:type II toxin-antitoxin system HicB family antitoxin [Chloroflexia bacterium]